MSSNLWIISAFLLIAAFLVTLGVVPVLAIRLVDTYVRIGGHWYLFFAILLIMGGVLLCLAECGFAAVCLIHVGEVS